MQELCKEICDIIEDRDNLTFSQVAKYIGVSKQCISKLKSEGTIGFRNLLRLSYLLFPFIQKSVMSKWCLRLNSTESIKQSFEYAAITRNKPLLNKLITKYKKEKGTIGEYVSVYTIIHGYMTNKISGYDLHIHLEKISTPQDEALTILIEFIKCYNYYFHKKFHLMLETAKNVERKLNKLSNKRELFIKECFLHRLAELLGPIYLHSNNLVLARHYANIIINADICPKTVSDASYIVGMTYLLGDANRSVKHLQKSYEFSKTIGDTDIEKEARLNLDCAKIYLGIKLDGDSNPLLIKLQNNRESEVTVALLKEEIGERDFLTLFEATASYSFPKLNKCFKKFFSQYNHFFSSLTVIEMQKRGENSGLAEMLSNFKIEIEGDVQFEETFISCFSSFDSCRSSCA